MRIYFETLGCPKNFNDSQVAKGILETKGYEIADKILDRHTTLTKYLMSLGVSEETAQSDACRIEHIISQESFDKIKEQLEKI